MTYTNLRARVMAGALPSTIAAELADDDDEGWDALARVCLDIEAETPRPIRAKDARLLIDARRTLEWIDGDGD